MNIEDIRLKMIDAHKAISKMEIRNLQTFSETYGLNVEVSYASDLKLAQNLVYYKYYEKLCALNVLNMQEKWERRLIEAESMYKNQFNKTTEIFIKKDKQGGRASIIKRMLLEGKDRAEIKNEIARVFPDVPLSNIGCQIAATICFLKKKEAKNANIYNKKI